MKDQILDTVAAIIYNGAAFMVFKADITRLFGTDEIKFQISIKNNKMVLESQEISQHQEIQESIPVKETIHVKHN